MSIYGRTGKSREKKLFFDEIIKRNNITQKIIENIENRNN
jgi:hypothetical protein